MESELSRPIEKALVGSIKGLSPILAAYITDKADLDDRKTVSMLSGEELQRLNSAVKDFLTSIVEGTYKARVYYDESLLTAQ